MLVFNMPTKLVKAAETLRLDVAHGTSSLHECLNHDIEGNCVYVPVDGKQKLRCTASRAIKSERRCMAS